MNEVCDGDVLASSGYLLDGKETRYFTFFNEERYKKNIIPSCVVGTNDENIYIPWAWGIEQSYDINVILKQLKLTVSLIEKGLDNARSQSTGC